MKLKILLHSLLPVLVALVSAAHSFADSPLPLSPYRADFSLDRVYETTRRAATNQERENIPTVKLQGRVRGVGFVDARFSIRRNKTWSSNIRKNGRETRDAAQPVLLQGRLAIGGSWKNSGRRIMPAAASIIGDKLKVVFPGRATGSKATRQRIYTITMKLDGSIVVQARISSIPRSAGRRGACGGDVGSGSMSEYSHNDDLAHTSGVVSPITGQQEVANLELSRVITISTDADPEWYQKYGEESNAVIASIINTAEAVFHNQLGLRFRIVKQHVYADASPYTTTDSSKLLLDFSRNPENVANLGTGLSAFHQEVDLKHLFTGKDLDGSVIGIAYIGTVCGLPSLAYGITQSYMEVANPAIFAHEVGHNFGAMHDASTREGLMYPAISVPPAQGFSDQSLFEINRHLSKYGTCISLEPLEPRSDEIPSPYPETPDDSGTTPAFLKLKQERIRKSAEGVIKLTGTLTSSSLEPLGSVGVRLLVAGEDVGRAVTKPNGRFVFFVRLVLPRGKKVSVLVRTEGGEITSNELVLGRTAAVRNAKAQSSNTRVG